MKRPSAPRKPSLGPQPTLVLDPDLLERLKVPGAEVLLLRAVPLAPSPLPGRGSRFVPQANDRAWRVTLEGVEPPAAAERVQTPELFHGLLTQDPSMRRLFRLIERVAADEASVLVRGETGSGKELVARAVHACSPRHKGPFRAINCAALPPNLLESELFGHVRGAFTGAVRDTPGHFQLAHRGTLFLDEVAELPLEMQAKLLRVLETRSITPVGGREPIPVDVRIVSATHRALRAEVAAGRFRADLMYRLRVIPVFLPPLRERPGDVPLLIAHLLREDASRSRRTIERVTPAALQALEAYSWPGNVRELRNVLAYARAVGEGRALLPSHLPPEVLDGREDGRSAAVVPGSGPDLELQRILRALERTGGKKAQAAKLLGMSRVTLWRHLRGASGA